MCVMSNLTILNMLRNIALDAFCLLEVYDTLQKRSYDFGIEWKEVIRKCNLFHNVGNVMTLT